ncbi:MAG: zinc-ribbon and DUF3426 domain-containing protein [Steroidobacteraceae bacterium]
MYTVCPKCGLMLVVTAADLRAAQGHVRCGRCRSVFNALESLSETAPPGALAPTAPAEQTVPPTGPPSGPPEPPGEDLRRAAEPQDEVWVEFEAVPPEHGAPQTGPEPPPSERAQAPHAAPAPEPPLAAEDVPAERSAHEPAPPPAPQEEPEPPPAPEAFELEPEREAHTGRWLAGAVALLLLLSAQLANYYRDTLATVPSVGPAVSAFYGALGIPIVPAWNVRAYEARQLGATVSGSNPRQITVRASIANRGPWPLPLPLLRVTLQDRYGRTIAARDVPPSDYLATAPAAPMLPAGGRIDATVAFVNPGPQAIGFEIDACLREGAAVVCAHGSR